MLGDLERSRRLYQTLLLPDFSGVDEVRRSYKALALRYHPDKNLNDPSAAEKFRDVRVAYEILSNAERKQKYDCHLRLFQPLRAWTPRAYGGDGAPTDFKRPPTPTKRAASASASAGRRARASAYTKEQHDFFRRREKERQADFRRRREEERRAAHERDVEALRREHAQQQQRRAVHSARRPPRGSPLPSPRPAPAAHKQTAKPPDRVRPVPASPRPPKSPTSLTSPTRMRFRDAGLDRREREKVCGGLEVRRRRLAALEATARQQLLVPAELLDRRRLWRDFCPPLRRLQRLALGRAESEARDAQHAAAQRAREALLLAAAHSVGAAAIRRDERHAAERFTLHAAESAERLALHAAEFDASLRIVRKRAAHRQRLADALLAAAQEEERRKAEAVAAALRAEIRRLRAALTKRRDGESNGGAILTDDIAAALRGDIPPPAPLPMRARRLTQSPLNGSPSPDPTVWRSCPAMGRETPRLDISPYVRRAASGANSPNVERSRRDTGMFLTPRV